MITILRQVNHQYQWTFFRWFKAVWMKFQFHNEIYKQKGPTWDCHIISQIIFIGFWSTFLGIYSDQKLLFIRQHHRNFEVSRMVNFAKICSDPISDDIFTFFKSSQSSLIPITVSYHKPSWSYQGLCVEHFWDFC